MWLLRMILHDWPTAYALQILKHLRASSTAGKTKLILLETGMDYACAGSIPEAKQIPGAEPPVAPSPLLPNLGRGGGHSGIMDIQ